MKQIPFLSLFLFGMTIAGAAPSITEDLLIDSVWAANQVSFDLHTVGDRQFVAYYDQERNMSLAVRRLGEAHWQKTILPSKLMWDSHNYVAMGIDEAGYIHVSGNMHTHPLCYFRSERPYDISSMLALHKMTGDDETNVTYPKFWNDGDGLLYFSYRSGTCGNGNVLVNRYDTEKGEWQRYLTKPLFEGIEAADDRAAYHSFIKDADGNYHFVWIWRWTPMVETTHQICYATTPDLLNWKNAAGEAVSLPFRPDNPALIVDGTPTKGGMHNGRFKLKLTEDGQPVVGYVKYDEAGLTQLYLARFIDGKWVSRQISDWDFRWEFVEGGDRMTIGGAFSFAEPVDSRLIAVEWETEKGESGVYAVDSASLEPVHGVVEIKHKYPDGIRDRLSDTPGLKVILMEGNGTTPEADARYLLKWEAMNKSHGRHAPEVMPAGPLSELRLLRVER